MHTALSSAQSGLVVSDLHDDNHFQQRTRHGRDFAAQKELMHELLVALIEMPETSLQTLVNAALEICGADSAGVSLEKEDRTEEAGYQWIATAGEYAKFLHVSLPALSPSTICLERGRAQRFTVSRRFYEQIGVAAAEVTDGLLIPWHAGKTRGTLWILAHRRQEAFDQEDHRILELLARCAAAGVRQQQRRAAELEQATANGEALMAAEVARKLKLPLQTAKAVSYLVERSRTSVEAKLLAEEMATHLEELSVIVKDLTRSRRGKKSLLCARD